MERWITKLIAFLVIFITMTLSGLLPIKVSSWFNKKGDKGVHYLSVLSCFGGGVFFGTYLMHMAPEVRHMLEESLLKPNNIIFPVPELVIGVGFFMLVFVDKIVMALSKRGKKSSVDKVSGQSEISLYAIKHIHENNPSPPSSPRIIAKGTHIHQQRAVHDPVNKNAIHNEIGNCADKEKQNNIKKVNGFLNGNNISCIQSNGSTDLEVTVHNSTATTDTDNGDQTIHINEDDLAARPYVFLVALSIDCIFEGMTLGLQTTNWGVWMLVIAILSHELVICFSFGLRILKLFSTRKVIFLIVFYAATIPVGVVMGFAILETTGSENQNVEIVSGIFQSLSAGIFIYVSFIEILNEELTHDSHFSKLFAVTFGFAFMAAMVLIDMLGSSDDHGAANSNGTKINYHDPGLLAVVNE